MSTSSPPAAEFASGAIFGTALLLSGVYSPSVIVSQMQLRNFHMLKSFLAASACSALVVRAADSAAYAPCRTRAPSSYGYFPYDANVIGGLLIGTGMALTGACPGTVVVQVGKGIRSGYFVGLGGLGGGILYTKLAPLLRRTPAPASSASAAASAIPTKADAHTLQAKLGLSTATLLTIYECFCLVALLASQTLLPSTRSTLTPITGGILIGAAQGITVLLTRRTVGVSTAYQDLGRRFWRAVSGGRDFAAAKTWTPAVVFAAGILAGSAVVARGVSGAGLDHAIAGLSDVQALVGGAAMVFGAGLAGGCPSGHGISGMATFSMSSFVSVAAMFAGGIAVATSFLP